jgi:hypothetical protein
MTFDSGGLDEKKAMQGRLHENGKKVSVKRRIFCGQKVDASGVMKKSGKNIGRKR